MVSWTIDGWQSDVCTVPVKKLFNYLTEGRLSVKLKRIFKTLCYIGDHVKENYAVGLLEEYIEYELLDGILLRNSFKKFPEIEGNWVLYWRN